MSQEAFQFSTTTEVLTGLPVGEALKESAKPECLAYADVFLKRAGIDEAADSHEIATGWALLAHLCRVTLWPSEPNVPFRPRWKDPGGPTMVPGDMDEGSAAAVRELGFATTDGELSARLLDVTWSTLRDPKAAREAVKNYLAAANPLFDPEHWTAYAARVERAARLARQLGDRGLVDEVLAEIEKRIVELDGSDPLYLSCHLMELLHEFKRGDPASMRRIAAKGARLAEAKYDFERAKNYHELVGRWCRRAGDDEGEKAARIAMAMSLHQQATHFSDPGQELVAAHWLEKAHEAYRNIPGMRDKADEVYAELREYQRRAAQSMNRITTEIPNASEMVKHARDWVAGKPLREALLALATVVQVTDFEEETKTARELMDKYPLQGLFGGVTMDHSGRVVARTTPVFSTDGENDFDLALWERVVRHVDLGYQVTVPTEIVPAMNQLNFEHSLTLADLVDLVVNNPFIHQGHEELFARGFLAGLRWDFAESFSIFVPQLENSLRHVLGQMGHEVTKRDKHGLQNFIQMGTMLSERRSELEEIFGKDIVQELRVLFLEHNGADLRNQIAHGLMRHDQFFHHASIYTWWFTFHLTIIPVQERFLKSAEATEDTEARNTAAT